MKYLYLDCFSGISGDMFIGALLDSGLKLEDLKKELAKLHVSGYHLTAERESQSAIYGTQFDVHLTDDLNTKDSGFVESHKNHHQARHLSEIIELINRSDLDCDVKKHAVNIFKDIGRAESKAHNLPLSKVHFHEIGAMDSIIDIVGSCIAINLLKVDKIVSSVISDGHGFINVAHGQMPVPVPAVANMLTEKYVPINQRSDVSTELLTPTGLGIIKEFVDEFRPIDEEDKIQNVGYGFGTRKTGSFNALRIFTCDKTHSNKVTNETSDRIMLLEANIDDQTGQSLSFAMDRLLSEGAYDVFLTPIYMKKNRPGIKFSVLTPILEADRFENLIFKYTTTKGIRHQIIRRKVMKRHFFEVNYKGKVIKIKKATYGSVSKITPEYEDCKDIAIKTGVSIEQVLQDLTKLIDKENF